jgi:predicted DNA-binding transcriptional regulator AlpA
MKTVSTTQAKKAARAAKLANQLNLFDSLPGCSLVAIPLVCALTGRSPASVWRDVKAGRLPKPVSAGPRCTRWRKSDLLSAQFAGSQS